MKYQEEENIEENVEENEDKRIIEKYNDYVQKCIKEVTENEFKAPEINKKKINIIKKNYNLFDTNIKLNIILNSINNFDTIQKKKKI